LRIEGMENPCRVAFRHDAGIPLPRVFSLSAMIGDDARSLRTPQLVCATRDAYVFSWRRGNGKDRKSDERVIVYYCEAMLHCQEGEGDKPGNPLICTMLFRIRTGSTGRQVSISESRAAEERMTLLRQLSATFKAGAVRLWALWARDVLG
jgi:hypothetical protein